MIIRTDVWSQIKTRTTNQFVFHRPNTLEKVGTSQKIVCLEKFG